MSAPDEPQRLSPLGWLALGAGIALVGTIVLAFALYRPPPPPVKPEHRHLPIADMDVPLRFVISPDGKQLAYIAVPQLGQTRVRLRSLAAEAGGEDERGLAGTNGARALFFGPDGHTLAFATGSELRRIDVANGVPRRIASTGSPVRTGTWSRRGEIVVETLSGRLFRVPADGGAPTALFSDDLVRREPRFLPDGNALLFIESGAGGNELRVLDLTTGKARAIASQLTQLEFDPAGFLLYTRDGALRAQRFDPATSNLIGRPMPFARSAIEGDWVPVFSLSHEGTLVYADNREIQDRLLWYDMQGKFLEELDASGQNFSIDLAGDDARVLVSRTDPSIAGRHVWMIGPAGQPPRRLVDDEALVDDPTFSPDGHSLAYVVHHDPSVVYLQDLEGGARRELYKPDKGLVLVEDWSDDGRDLVVVHHTYAAPSRVLLVPVAGGPPKVAGEFDWRIEEVTLSPDGRWLAYSAVHAERWEVYVVPVGAAAGTRWQVSEQGGVQPRWHADGGGLHFLAPDGALMSARITFGKDGLELGAREVLWRSPIATPSPNADQYRLSADGKRVLLSVPQRKQEGVTLHLLRPWRVSFGLP